MKKDILLIILLFSASLISAQEVVSSAGETQSVAGYEVSWTIGETVVETGSDGANTITQGFHQTKLIVTALDELGLTGNQIKVFPNPTQDYVVVQLKEFIENSSVFLFDFNGKMLKEERITSTSTKLNLGSYASGTYILRLRKESELLQTFKIVKR